MSAINIGELLMTIGLDTKGFDTNLSAAQDKATKSGGFFQDAFAFATGGLVLKGVEFLGSAVGNMFSGAIDGARESALVMAQTEQVIKSTGNAAGVSTEYIADLAGSLSDASGTSLFSGEQVQQASNMILTFTNIKGKVVDAATAIAVDMAQALGGEPQAQSIALGKALNDPIKGITALTRVGVTFTDEQKLQIKTMQDAGDMAGAQTVILNELNKEFGGQAKAAADASGGWVQFTARMDDAAKGIAIGLLPVFDKFASFLNTTVAPVIEQTLTNALTYITTVVIPALIKAWESIQPALAVLVGYWNDTLLPALNTLWSFIENNIKPLFATLVSVLLAVVVPAFVAWSTAAIAAATATITALAPVLLPIAAIGAAVFLLYKAWDTNFLGIRTTLTTFWNTYGLPIFNTFKLWLDTNLPIALQKLSDFWNNVLLPALRATWAFIQNYVMPILSTIVSVHFAILQGALVTLAGFWTGTLLPALTAVWNFLDTYVIPIFKLVVDVHIAAMGAALRLLTGFWKDTLLPALRDAHDYFNRVLIPIFERFSGPTIKAVNDALGAIVTVWEKTLQPAWESMKTYLGVTLGPAFNTFGGVLDGIKGFFEGIGTAVSDLIGYLRELKEWLDKVGKISVPSKPSNKSSTGESFVGKSSGKNFSGSTSDGGFGGQTVMNNYYLNAVTNATAEGVISNFRHMQAKAKV